MIDRILELYSRGGQSLYFGEHISQSAHALQSAWFASQAGAPAELQIAALLHDVGHLLHQRGEDVADRGIDAHHERIGATFLSRFFPVSISAPVALHVEAKRYLCRHDTSYAAALSPASQQSLRLQGGVMSEAESVAFERKPHWQDAVELRRWDDTAKIVDLDVPPWDHYLEMIARFVR